MLFCGWDKKIVPIFLSHPQNRRSSLFRSGEQLDSYSARANILLDVLVARLDQKRSLFFLPDREGSTLTRSQDASMRYNLVRCP